jgi:hypothetical protein
MREMPCSISPSVSTDTFNRSGGVAEIQNLANLSRQG